MVPAFRRLPPPPAASVTTWWSSPRRAGGVYYQPGAARTRCHRRLSPPRHPPRRGAPAGGTHNLNGQPAAATGTRFAGPRRRRRCQRSVELLWPLPGSRTATVAAAGGAVRSAAVAGDADPPAVLAPMDSLELAAYFAVVRTAGVIHPLVRSP